MDQNADGTAEHRRTTANTYDQRRLLQQVLEVDLGTDGVVDFRDITTNTYDGHSNLVVQLRETDSNADGTPESVVTITTTYRVGGH